MSAGAARRVGALAVAAGIVLSAAAQLLMKAGMIELHGVAPAAAAAAPWSELARSGLWTFAGLLCYGASMLAWLVALSRFQLSYAYPLLSASYVLVYGVSASLPYFSEEISVARAVGIGLIIAGVALVTRSGSGGEPRHAAGEHGAVDGR